jgi:hypothetical protein
VNMRSARTYVANKQKISYQDLKIVGWSASRSLLVSNLPNDCRLYSVWTVDTDAGQKKK